MRRRSFAGSFFGIFLLAASAVAGETPTDPKLVVRERTVYVPYEKLKETFEKEGRGVFLPYEEFLKLWNAGQPKEKPPEEIKPPADAVIAGGSYTGVAKESSARFEVTYKVKALGKTWSELALPLKNVAVETATLSDPLAVFAPKGEGYTLILPKPGDYTLTLAFSVRVDSKPGQRKIEFGIPPTAVSRLELSIPEKDLRVEVTPKMAATVATPEGEGTRLLAFVGNADQVAVTWMPPASKVEKGESLTIAAQAVHVELGERILRLDTMVNFKIERNEEEVFRIKVPKDMRLLSVKGGNIREWTNEKGELLVRLHSPVKDLYSLALRFERILEAAPGKPEAPLDVPFPSVVGALREDGFVTLAHESGLRVRVESSGGLSQIDPRELPDALKRNNLLASFRYMAHPLSLVLKIEQVQPQIQSSVTAVTSLGIEEDGLFGWVDYQIAKVGVFRMKLKFENRWEVVSVGDPQTVEDFQTAVDGAYKILTVNLKNKALGNFRLPFKLSASGRAAPGQLSLESVQVLDTRQDAGLLGVSAPKAFKLSTVDRAKMAAAPVQRLFATGLLAQLPADFDLPLAYSYTQQPASVKIALERRQTEIRATGYHSVIVSEAGLEMTHKLEYVVEFAGVDRLQFSLPSALDDKLLDIKCPGFKEKKKVSELNGRSTWEILLQDKVLGAVPVTIGHKENLKSLEPEKPQEISIPDIRAEDVKSQTGFIAVRKDGALEINPNKDKVKGLEVLEAANLPTEMKSTNVYIAYRYFQPERELVLELTRHVPVEVTSTVVDLMRTTFVVSEERKLTVRTELWVENAKGEQYLELELPKDAVIRALAVKGVSVSPQQKKGGGTLVKLPAGGKPYPVQIVYAYAVDTESRLGGFGGLALSTLKVSQDSAGTPVPVNKIEADVYVPEDYAYMNFGGTLHAVEGAQDSNTLKWIARMLTGERKGSDVAAGDARFPSPPPLLGAFQTQGRMFRFQTLAPVGTLTINYCGRKLFWLVDVLVFLGVLGLGWFLTRAAKGARAAPPGAGLRAGRVPRLWVAIAFVVLPLCLGWFSSSDFGEVYSSAFRAGLVLCAFFAFVALKSFWHAQREARLAAAPDPFLEDAVAEKEQAEKEKAKEKEKPQEKENGQAQSKDKEQEKEEKKANGQAQAKDKEQEKDEKNEKKNNKHKGGNA